jgi:hypothetical protein
MLLARAQGLDLDIDAAGARQPCLYLIPDYDRKRRPRSSLRRSIRRSLTPRLDDWHRDTGTGPAERTYEVFHKWFDVRFYPLIQDLVGEELTATEVDEEFLEELRTELQELELRP